MEEIFYKQSKYGNLIKISTQEIVIKEEGNLLWEEFKVYQINGGSVDVDENFYTDEEEIIFNREVVPEFISQMKLRMQLILGGYSISLIEQAIQSIPDTIQREIVSTKWEKAVVFERTDPTLNAMASMIGISQDQLDTIFKEGNKILTI